MPPLQRSALVPTLRQWTAETTQRRRACLATPLSAQPGRVLSKVSGCAAALASAPGRLLLGNGLLEPGRSGLYTHGVVGWSLRQAFAVSFAAVAAASGHSARGHRAGLFVADTVLVFLRLMVVTLVEAILLGAARVIGAQPLTPAQGGPQGSPAAQPGREVALPSLQRVALKRTAALTSCARQDELDVVENYLNYILVNGNYGGDVVVKDLGKRFQVNTRIWNFAAPQWTTRELYTHWQDQAETTLDLLHHQEHYRFFEAQGLVDPQAREASIGQEIVQANTTDAGGGGDCLFLAFAYGLNYQNFRELTDAHRQAQRVTTSAAERRAQRISHEHRAHATVSQLRQELVAYWQRKLESPSLADAPQARATLDQLLLAAADEGTSVILDAYAQYQGGGRGVARFSRERYALLTRSLGLLTHDATEIRAKFEEMSRALRPQLP